MFSFAEYYTAEEAVSVLKAMLRVLLFRSPWFAEMAWMSSEALRGAETDRWIEIRAPYGIAWTWLGSDGSGKSSLLRPDVPESQIVVMQQDLTESRELREKYRWMIRWLENHELKASFVEKVSLLDNMGTSDFAWPHLTSFLHHRRIDLRNSAMNPDAQRRIIPFERQAVYDFRSQFLQCRFPGYVMAFIRLLHLSWRDVTDEVLRDESGSDVKLASINDFLFHTFSWLIKHNGPQAIERAAMEMHDEGRGTLDLAKGMLPPESYFDWLFGAGYLFYGASVAYDYLALELQPGNDSYQRYRRMRNACNELEIRCWTALLHWLHDRITKGFYFEKCRQEVDDARRKGGELAARLKANELIGNALLYPASYREALLQPPDSRKI